MNSPISDLIATPLVANLMAQAREADLHAFGQQDRAAAWSRWALNGLVRMTGAATRDYVAVRLPGKFYDPRGTAPDVAPHIEVPSWALHRNDLDIHHRFGQIGNALLFEWWLVPEVTALRRVLLPAPAGSNAGLLAALFDRHEGLVETLTTMNDKAAPQWTVIERAHAARSEQLVEAVRTPFTTDELARIFPPARDLGLALSMDPRLTEQSGTWLPRRLGVWRLESGDRGSRASLGVATPRLTRNSMFADPLFSPVRESAAALLVRCALLARLMASMLDLGAPGVIPLDPAAASRGTYFRAVVAKVGEKLPEASVESAVALLETYQEAEKAWDALTGWAKAGHILTVDRQKFCESFTRLGQ